MKTNQWTYIKVCALVGVFVTLTSCNDTVSDEFESDMDSFCMSSEVTEKISYGCDASVYKTVGNEKIETKASDEYLAEVRLKMNTIRANKDAATTQYVGVIKDLNGNCGDYDEVIVYYDCEDKNNKTTKRGYRGDWYVSKNIEMIFCVVPVDKFVRTDKWYGVVNFSKQRAVGTDYEHNDVALIHLAMDAQDARKPVTQMYHKKHGDVRRPVSEFGNMRVDPNGNLNFEIFAFASKNYAFAQYPKFDFSYGVFGSLHRSTDIDYQGYVFSDDEDSNNANFINITFENNPVTPPAKEPYQGIVLSNANTQLYISKIRN